jgi:predicted NAD/FAD-binding protein
MLFDIARFKAFATDILLAGKKSSMESIEKYLERERYLKQLCNDYLLPTQPCMDE